MFDCCLCLLLSNLVDGPNVNVAFAMGSFTYYVISKGGRGFQMLDYGGGGGGGGGGGWPLIT